MSALRKKLIRLAHDNPGKVREALLPLLKQGAAAFEAKRILADLEKAGLGKLSAAEDFRWVLRKTPGDRDEIGMAALTLRDDLKRKSFLDRNVVGGYDERALPGLVRRLSNLAAAATGW